MTRSAFIPLLLSLVLAAAALARSDAPWEARLESLTPDQPLDYFVLAEDVLDAPSPDRALARQLLVRALVLDRTSRLTPSVLRLLATIADDADLARALTALADASSPVHSPFGSVHAPEDPLAAPSAQDADAALSSATALGRYRAGDYARAATLLDRPEVLVSLRRYSTLLPGLSAILREVRDRPNCRECHNARVVRADASSAEAINNTRLCYTCRGNPGPRLSDRDTLNHLRVEAALLNAQHASWSTQFLMDAAAPLRDLDPDSLADLYLVDPAATHWVDGRWINPATTPEPSPSDTPPNQ